MANHKRGRPKNRRAGCLMCKPHKANGIKKRKFFQRKAGVGAKLHWNFGGPWKQEAKSEFLMQEGFQEWWDDYNDIYWWEDNCDCKECNPPLGYYKGQATPALKASISQLMSGSDNGKK